MVKVNGECLSIANRTISEQLTQLGYDIRRVAVELNGDIVPRTRYDDTVLHDGDNVEIVSFVGGG